MNYRILKNHVKKPKWWEPDTKTKFIKVLKTYRMEYMPEEYIELRAFRLKELAFKNAFKKKQAKH